MKFRSAIVVDATGLVGLPLIQQLCNSEDYVSVIAISQTKLDYSHPKLVSKVMPFEEIGEKDIEYANDLFYCIETNVKKTLLKEQGDNIFFQYPMNVASIAKKREINHFIIITKMGAKSNSLFYTKRVLGKLEEQLKTFGLNRVSIIHPSFVIGNNSEKIKEMILKLFNPILIGPFRRFHTIESNQLSLALMIIALYGKNSPFMSYKSNQLLTMELPKKEEEVEEEISFNWDKFKGEEVKPLDEEVVFNRIKYSVDEKKK